MKLIVLFFLVLLGGLYTDAQNKPFIVTASKQDIILNSNFREQNLYILCRGTTGKSNLIGRNFNLSDTNVTHTGIGLIEDKKLKIFNVTNEKNDYGNTSFRVDSLRSFIQNADVFYLRIWKIKVTRHEFEKAGIFIKSIEQRKIVFDFDFKINNGDSLYCSEFSAGMLAYINKRKFSFALTSKKIDNELFEIILGRKWLDYYPVDFFIKSRFVKSMIAYFIKE